ICSASSIRGCWRAAPSRRSSSRIRRRRPARARPTCGRSCARRRGRLRRTSRRRRGSLCRPDRARRRRCRSRATGRARTWSCTGVTSGGEGGTAAAMTPTTDRRDDAGAWMRDLCDQAQRWAGSQSRTTTTGMARTPAYMDLLFSFGLARLGKTDAARDLLGRAKSALAGIGEAHTWLYNALEYRIKQALDGRSPSGPLPTEQLEYLEHVERLERYVIDRFRKHSSILEPDHGFNPCRHWGAHISEVEATVVRLSELTSPAEFQAALRQTLERTERDRSWAKTRHRIVWVGLFRFDVAGPDLTRE